VAPKLNQQNTDHQTQKNTTTSNKLSQIITQV